MEVPPVPTRAAPLSTLCLSIHVHVLYGAMKSSMDLGPVVSGSGGDGLPYPSGMC